MLHLNTTRFIPGWGNPHSILDWASCWWRSSWQDAPSRAWRPRRRQWHLSGWPAWTPTTPYLAGWMRLLSPAVTDHGEMFWNMTCMTMPSEIQSQETKWLPIPNIAGPFGWAVFPTYASAEATFRKLKRLRNTHWYWTFEICLPSYKQWYNK